MHITVQKIYDLQYITLTLKWIYELSKRIYIYFPQTCHGISHVSPLESYHVSKKIFSKEMRAHINFSSRQIVQR